MRPLKSIHNSPLSTLNSPLSTLKDSRVLVGPSLGVEIVVAASFFHKDIVQYGGDADDEEIQGTEDLGIHGVPVHLVPYGELVVRRVGVEEGEVP